MQVTNTKSWYKKWGHCYDKPDHVVVRQMRGIWMSLEIWAKETLECCMECLMYHSSGRLEDQNA